MTRRGLLTGLLAGGAALGWPRRAARAEVSAADRKFVFVFVNGGWDPTRVFAPEFDNPIVSMEEQAALSTASGLPFVDHPDRPSVRRFFEAYGARVSVLNGLLVPSVAHEACRGLLFTGGTSGKDPDWATRVAAARRADYALPHLVLGTVAFPGELTETTCRIGRSGQLAGLLDGSAVDSADQPYPAPDAQAEAIMDSYLADRVVARLSEHAASDGWTQQLGDVEYASARAEDLQAEAGALTFSAGGSLSEASTLAAEALARGVSRCVTIEHPVVRGNHGWDSHSENDTMQGVLFEDLFSGLHTLMGLLEGTPGPAGGALSDETAIVVISEMGRTPWLTPSGGKDHWPYTSAMLLGSGVSGGGRIIGGLDESYYGRHIDLDSGELDPDGARPGFAELGATLMALGDVDPGDWMSDASPIGALMA